MKASSIQYELKDQCRACGSESSFIQKGTLLGISVSYFECPNCFYIQTEAPFWLDQAYSDAISDSDTGIMVRNQANARIALATMLMLRKIDPRNAQDRVS